MLVLSVIYQLCPESRYKQLTAILPLRSFWTTVNAGLPNKPIHKLSDRTRWTNWLTKDLDQVLGSFTEVGSIDTLLCDLDVGVRLAGQRAGQMEQLSGLMKRD
jgi:hypothetical protein